MSNEKEIAEIAEIAKVIEITEQVARDAHCGYPSPTMHAKSLYWKGYRKQAEGEWIEEKHDNGRKSARRRLVVYATYKCSSCGYSNGRYKSNFCRNCGAHMKGADNAPAADVVPRAELEKIKQEKDALIKNYAECMKDYAKEIFAEIDPWLDDYRKNYCTGLQFITFLEELKKKYTEGE